MNTKRAIETRLNVADHPANGKNADRFRPRRKERIMFSSETYECQRFRDSFLNKPIHVISLFCTRMAHVHRSDE